MLSRFARISYARTMHRGLATVPGIEKVGVVGFLRLMGHGVAQMAAAAGYDVVGIEMEQRVLDAGMQRINNSLQLVAKRNVKKGMDEGVAAAQATETLGRITASTDMHALKDVDLVVEAIAENKELKLKFHKQLGGVVQPGAIFASNTSSLQITGMAEASARPKQFVGLHFFNPVQMMKLVEVIRTDHTTNEVVRKC